MSRTYRKSVYIDSESYESHLTNELTAWKERPTARVRIKRTEAQMLEANRQADACYEERILALAKSKHISIKDAKVYCDKSLWSGVYLSYVSVYRYPVRDYYMATVTVTREEVVAGAKSWYDKQSRDGKGNDACGLRKSWREMTKKAVRRETKKLTHAIVREEDYDKPYPGDYLGKKYIWSIW